MQLNLGKSFLVIKIVLGVNGLKRHCHLVVPARRLVALINAQRFFHSADSFGDLLFSPTSFKMGKADKVLRLVKRCHRV